MAPDLGHCQKLASPDITNFVVSCFILVGLVLSYAPQHYRIIRRRSSQGISPYFVLLGTTSGTCAIANILTLSTSRADMACCAVNDSFSCTAGLLGIAQIGVQWTCFFVLMFLFLIFVERPPSDAFDAETLAQYSSPYISKTALAEAVSVVAVALIHFIVVFLVSIVIFARFPAKLHSWAVVLGIFAALLSSVQYVPQIYTTWKLQHVGSLSIPMMCIQTPGGFVFAASLAARLGTAGWSAWSVYLILGTLQGVLLVMAIYFEVRDRRKAQRKLDKKKPRRSVVEGSVWDDDEEEEEEEGSAHGDDDNDDTPLLRDSDSTQRSYHTAQGLSRNVPAVLAPERLIQDSSSSSEPEARNKRQGKRNTK